MKLTPLGVLVGVISLYLFLIAYFASELAVAF